ncbi:MAG: 4Fe-4S binding protein [Dehalococcoidia bacterium]|jgi:2-oxoglutarate ferredoxin oxidoreductase subunit delta|nr:4Fe-4S binding protein [Dehalococcoidia bacterium]|tara:strand:- start:291 stop:536 length:246 start_codon:yes stop_codon:yes gene_type:complete
MPRTVGYVEIDASRCKGCEICVVYCPEDTLAMSTTMSKRGYMLPEMTRDNCTGCMQCARVCPDVAISVYRATRRAMEAISA